MKRTPNTQNIPIHTKPGKGMRKLFRRLSCAWQVFSAIDFDMLEARTAAKYNEQRLPRKAP